MTLCWNSKRVLFTVKNKILFAQFYINWIREIDDIEEVEKSARKLFIKRRISKCSNIEILPSQPYWNWSRLRWKKKYKNSCITLQKKLTVFHNIVRARERIRNIKTSIMAKLNMIEEKCLHFSRRREQEIVLQSSFDVVILYEVWHYSKMYVYIPKQ